MHRPLDRDGVVFEFEGVPEHHRRREDRGDGVGDILAGKRAITANTDLRLCRFFGLSDGWWLRLQADYDTEVARSGLAKTLAKIKPLAAMTQAAAA